MTHAEMVASLAEDQSASNKLVFMEHRMGSWWMENGTPTPDVLVVYKSFTNPNITAYDVKTSRADFLADVRERKFERYLPFCNRFLFAAPTGMIARADLPPGCGLVVYNEDKRSWSTSKAATPRPRVEYADWHWLSLLFAKQGEAARVRDVEERRRHLENAVDSRWKRDLPKKIAAALEVADDARHEREALREAYLLTCKALGQKPLENSMWDLPDLVRRATGGLTPRNIAVLEELSELLRRLAHGHDYEMVLRRVALKEGGG